MKRLVLLFLAAVSLWSAPPVKPKLVLMVVIDQFRYDYLTRFRSDYNAGFARVLDHGAVFMNAHYPQYPTVTAVGHSTVLSGATPSISGIVGNDWFDRETGKSTTSVGDPTVQLLGGTPGRTGSSPRRLLVSTLGDELKMAGKGTKVIGISIKDRSAILPSGHMADAAYWLDDVTGHWVSSSYYFADLPAWVKEVNQTNPGNKYVNAQWMSMSAKAGDKSYRTMSATADAKLYRALESTPYGNEMIEALAEKCIEAEQLGHHSGSDLLTVSFSANDYVGHALGPDSPEVHDISIRTDRLLGKLLDYIETHVGKNQTLFVMSGDHGVSPTPEANAARNMPGGRLSGPKLMEAVESALSQKFGAGKWISAGNGGGLYLNQQLIRDKNANEAEVERVAADALRQIPHISRVYTRQQLMNGSVPGDFIGNAYAAGFYGPRSGELFLVPEPYWFVAEGATGTTHGTPFNYDNHVPVIFMGAGIPAGKFTRRVLVNDIAPTLAAMLEIDAPSGSIGNPLEELFRDTPPAKH